MTGRRAVDTPAACPASGGDPRCLRARSHPRRRVLASGGWACHAGLGGSAAGCQTAGGPLAGWVCTRMWITCAKRHRACARAVEMLGIPAPGRGHKRAFNWENTARALCMQEKPELSTRHAAKAHK
jgi:hypothetical protein